EVKKKVVFFRAQFFSEPVNATQAIIFLLRKWMDILQTGDQRRNPAQLFFYDNINCGIRVNLPNCCDESGTHHHIAKPVRKPYQYFESADLRFGIWHSMAFISGG